MGISVYLVRQKANGILIIQRFKLSYKNVTIVFPPARIVKKATWVKQEIGRHNAKMRISCAARSFTAGVVAYSRGIKGAAANNAIPQITLNRTAMENNFLFASFASCILPAPINCPIIIATVPPTDWYTTVKMLYMDVAMFNPATTWIPLKE